MSCLLHSCMQATEIPRLLPLLYSCREPLLTLTVWLLGETLLAEAVAMCSKTGMVRPSDHIVVVQKVHDSFMIKVCTDDCFCCDSLWTYAQGERGHC